jgi:hypothetical protein
MQCQSSIYDSADVILSGGIAGARDLTLAGKLFARQMGVALAGECVLRWGATGSGSTPLQCIGAARVRLVLHRGFATVQDDKLAWLFCDAGYDPR